MIYERHLMDEFQDIVEKEKHRIFTLCRYILGRHEDAEDVTQDVIVRLWKHWDRVQEMNIGAWLTRVARNACIDLLRRRKRNAPTFAGVTYDVVIEVTADTRPDARKTLESSEIQTHVRQALSEMDEPYRSILILREIQELQYNEISESLGMPLTSIKVYLHRGRQRLRELLRERVGNV